jgi:hypothetical protein
VTEDLIIQRAFPSEINEEVKSTLQKISVTSIYETSIFFSVRVDGEELKIPYRLYYKENALDHLNDLTPVQREIVCSIYSRHHDGFVRQKCISEILSSRHSWTTPFIIKIVGEYVIDILVDINERIDVIDKTNLKNFLLSNEEFYKLTKDRVTSYWDCYYRMQYPKKENYVGIKLLKYFDKIISDSKY